MDELNAASSWGRRCSLSCGRCWLGRFQPAKLIICRLLSRPSTELAPKTNRMAAVARDLRLRGVGLALRLAHEANEAQQLALALRRVREYEAKVQREEERKANGTPCRRTKYARVLRRENVQKTPRRSVVKVGQQIAHLLQRSLKRYVLRKRPTASFSLTLSRAKFIKFFKGFGKIEATEDGQKLRFTMLSDCKQSVNDKFGELLGFPPGDQNAIIRRFYGKKFWKARDCSFVDVIDDNPQKNKVCAFWAEEKVSQIDLFGKKISTTRPKTLIRFPRNTLPAQSKAPTEAAAAAKKAYIIGKQERIMRMPRKKREKRKTPGDRVLQLSPSASSGNPR